MTEPRTLSALQEPFWNMPMVMCWEKYRSAESITTWWESTRRNRGASLPASVVTLEMIIVTHEGEPSMSDAKAEVLRALGEGEVGAIGYHGDEVERRQVRSDFWSGVVHLGNEDFTDRWVSASKQQLTGVLIPRADVVRRWPGEHLAVIPPSASEKTPASPTASAPVPKRPKRHRALGAEGKAIHDWFVANYGHVNDAAVVRAKGESTWEALAKVITTDGKAPGGKGITLSEANVHQFLETMRSRGVLSPNPAKPS